VSRSRFGLDAKQPGDRSTRKEGAGKDVEHGRGAEIRQEDREQERGRRRADLGEGRSETGALAAQRSREDFPRQQVGLGIRPEIGHEAEQREAREQQGRARVALVTEGGRHVTVLPAYRDGLPTVQRS
jgi:hypothetical protein